jgi:hypothetical protein
MQGLVMPGRFATAMKHRRTTLRRTLAVVLCLLLLSLQSQVLVHPIEHLGGEPKASEATLTSTHEDPRCVECPLLTGGLAAALRAPAHVAFDAPPGIFVTDSYRSRAADAPAWFQSRAPPALL